jgi:hypothetical protein
MLYPLVQSERQCLIPPHLPDVVRCIQLSTRQFHLPLQGDFVHMDADANRFCLLACSTFWTPRHLLHDPWHYLQPSVAGCVVAMLPADQLRVGLDMEFFCAFLAGCKMTWARTG